MKIIISEDQLRGIQSIRRRYSFIDALVNNSIYRLNPCRFSSLNYYNSEIILEVRDYLPINYFEDKSFTTQDLKYYVNSYYGDKIRDTWNNRGC